MGVIVLKCDYHMHTYYSDDSSTPMKSQVKRAIELGLDEICFTDHVDYGVKVDCDEPNPKHMAVNVNYPKYFREIDEMRNEFRGIKIKAGLEFGVQTHTINQYERLFERYHDELDFILLSIHQINDLDLWSGEYQSGRTQDEYNRCYYNELLNVMKNFHDYSVLAHLDLIVRYDRKGIYPFDKVRDIVNEILRTAIDDHKGIELNTSSRRYKLTDTQPSREILKMYREMGGEIITLGSDAHTPDYVYAYMEEAKNILRDLGYRYFCTFDKMNPVFHEL